MRGAKPKDVVAGTSAVTRTPPPPAWLSKSAKAEWRRVGPILIHERKVLTVADLATFASYCVAAGQVADAADIIAREGMTFMSVSGPKKHPAVAIQSDAMTQARLLANELGLTPVSRSRPAIRDDAGGSSPDGMDY